MDFFINYPQLLAHLGQVKPLAYIRNRNFLDGDVTRLSPFVTHGIIDTCLIAHPFREKYAFAKVEKFVFQLAWREYFHRIWEAKGEAIFSDLKHPQPEICSADMPVAVLRAETGIRVLDEALQQLYTTGYMHNHARMWLASLISNVAKTDWRCGARWMFYHLLDGDLASNSLSWQWVAGSFRQRPYLANQDNLNKFSRTSQMGSFLDVSYETLAKMEVPLVLQQRTPLNLQSGLPQGDRVTAPKLGETIFLRHIYNLDPTWHQGEPGRHILLIEPAKHKVFPLSPKRWAFIEHWARQIEDIEIFVGSFETLFPQGVEKMHVHFTDDPFINHWRGKREPRRWLAPEVKGYFPSFFSFWKKAKKQIMEQWS